MMIVLFCMIYRQNIYIKYSFIRYLLTLSSSADDILKYFSYFFSRKQVLAFHANCLHGDSLHEISKPVFIYLFFWQNKENINLSSAEF